MRTTKGIMWGLIGFLVLPLMVLYQQELLIVLVLVFITALLIIVKFFSKPIKAFFKSMIEEYSDPVLDIVKFFLKPIKAFLKRMIEKYSDPDLEVDYTSPTVETWEILMKKGSDLHKKKQFRESIIYYKAAIKDAKKLFGDTNPNYIVSLNHLAAVYGSSGEYNEAESLFFQSLDITRKNLGEKHPIYIDTLTALADFYKATGRYGKSESLYYQVSEIISKLVGKKHTVYLSSLNNLGFLEILNGKTEDGMKKLLQVSRLRDLMLTQKFSSADEKEIQEYIRTFSNDYFILISVFYKHYSELKKYTPLVFDVVLRRKAISLEITTLRRDKILSGQSPEVRSKFEKLRNIRKLIARLMTEPPEKMSPESHRKRIYNLEQQADALEKELAAYISELELYKKLENAEHKIIASLLPEDTHLVEFVSYMHYDFQKKEWHSFRYIAFILSKHAPKDIQMVDIGEASEIDNLITQFRTTIHALTIRFKKERERNIATVPIEISDKQIATVPIEISDKQSDIGKLLYKKLFGHIADKIGKTKKVLISPDGNIILLPFEALQMPDNRYVIEDFEISYIDSGRDLLRLQYRQPPQSRSVILADPDFDLAGQGMLPDRSRFKDIKPLPRLHGTKEEGETIRKLLPLSDFYTDKEVLDEKVKQIRGPEIFHIATHGLFISEQKKNERIFQSENPLLRSGLALTGVNSFFQGKNPARYAGDGLLMALDVSSMNLTGTDLVVLSACQTGLGEVRSGDGIYGLRRAFTIAGARTQIVSLWSVPDQETKELMISFYTKILKGKGKAEALRESQREMIAKLRKQGTPEPFLWGAFVCIGDPGRMKQR